MTTERTKRVLGLQVAGLAIVLAAMVAGTIYLYPLVMTLISDMPGFRGYIQSYGDWGVAVFLGIQALQVVIAVIPGELTQLAGGFIYGTTLGTVYSLAGILIGSVIAFYLARGFGFPVLRSLVPAKGIEKFSFLINSPKAEVGMLVLFLIPGVPKDVLTFIAGLTPVRSIRFLLMASVARFPGILMASYVGSHVAEQDYTGVIVVSAVALVLFVAGVLLQDRVVRWVKSHRHPDASPGHEGTSTAGSPPTSASSATNGDARKPDGSPKPQ
jgi:uncharacterized membrane protein YdjX (TVP38/TMEM64 family)